MGRQHEEVCRSVNVLQGEARGAGVGKEEGSALELGLVDMERGRRQCPQEVSFFSEGSLPQTTLVLSLSLLPHL